MRSKEDDLNRLAYICLRIANYVDRHGEKDDIDFGSAIGYGYRALGYYLRQGVKAIADIQEDYSEAVSRQNLAKIGESEAYDFLEDIFGDKDVHTINDADKERIKAFVRSIYAEWDAAWEQEKAQYEEGDVE